MGLKSNNNKKIILISGPTASGKSQLSVLLAKKINGEIINADSMQIYKEISILSSRPKIIDLKRVKHHLYGFQSVNTKFSVGQWLKKVKKCAVNIIKKGKVPILVGGTGLYFKAVTSGLSRIPKISNKKRKAVKKIYDKIGYKKFYKKLISSDPLCKNKILASDTQRVLRAFEVKRFTKKSIYEWAKNTKSDFTEYDVRKIYLNIPREKLLIKINDRTKKILADQKCLKEVKNFLNLNIIKSLPANKIIGIAEINSFFEGRQTYKELIENVNIKTRQYAKRQSTWSRGHMADWTRVYSDKSSNLFKKILKEVS